MKNKLISVIMPIYNRTELLKEAIESVLYQDYKHFELLLIMDGSPKETRDIVMSYKYNPHVRIFETEKQTGNACIPRNIGILESYGDYIAFIDSDDIMLDGRLESLFNELSNGADIVYSNYNILYQETGELKPVFSSQTNLELMLSVGNYLCQCSVGGKKEAFIKLGGFKREMNYMEDYELWCRALYFGYKIIHIPKILATYRIHDSNLEKELMNSFWKKILLNEYQKIPNTIRIINYNRIKL